MEFLYLFFRRRRWLLLLLVTAFLGTALFFAFQLRLVEDLSKVVPLDKQLTKTHAAYQPFSLSHLERLTSVTDSPMDGTLISIIAIVLYYFTKISLCQWISNLIPTILIIKNLIIGEWANTVYFLVKCFRFAIRGDIEYK